MGAVLGGEDGLADEMCNREVSGTGTDSKRKGRTKARPLLPSAWTQPRVPPLPAYDSPNDSFDDVLRREYPPAPIPCALHALHALTTAPSAVEQSIISRRGFAYNASWTDLAESSPKDLPRDGFTREPFTVEQFTVLLGREAVNTSSSLTRAGSREPLLAEDEYGSRGTSPPSSFTPSRGSFTHPELGPALDLPYRASPRHRCRPDASAGVNEPPWCDLASCDLPTPTTAPNLASCDLPMPITAPILASCDLPTPITAPITGQLLSKHSSAADGAVTSAPSTTRASSWTWAPSTARTAAPLGPRRSLPPPPPGLHPLVLGVEEGGLVPRHGFAYSCSPTRPQYLEPVAFVHVALPTTSSSSRQALPGVPTRL